VAHWSPDTLHEFATLFNRMVDDFLAYDAEQGPSRGAVGWDSGVGCLPARP
jgi:hypothetical protein